MKARSRDDQRRDGRRPDGRERSARCGGLAACGEHAERDKCEHAQDEKHQDACGRAAEAAAEHRSQQRSDAQARQHSAPAAHEAGLRGRCRGRGGGSGRSRIGGCRGRRLGRFLHRGRRALIAEVASAAETLGGIDVGGRETEGESRGEEQDPGFHGAILRESWAVWSCHR